MNYARFDLGRSFEDLKVADAAELALIPPGETYEVPGAPKAVIEGVGLKKFVYVRDGKMRYGLDGWGRRVYGAWVARWYAKRLLREYRKAYC